MLTLETCDNSSITNRQNRFILGLLETEVCSSANIRLHLRGPLLHATWLGDGIVARLASPFRACSFIMGPRAWLARGSRPVAAVYSVKHDLRWTIPLTRYLMSSVPRPRAYICEQEKYCMEVRLFYYFL